jgi:AcrR family transcriptional regulator
MAQGHRRRVHDATLIEIKQAARRLMAEGGTAAVSLRAIAHEVGMTAPGLYRYFRDRDDLITALLVDTYDALAETLEAARAAHASEHYADQLTQVGMAYRDWALAHPVEYRLILGNPIPGYHAPVAVTTPPARRSLAVFLALLHDAWRDGELTLTDDPAPELEARLAAFRAEAGLGELPLSALQLALATWGTLHGLISLELFGHLDPIIGDAGPLYRAALAAAVAPLHPRR